MNQPIPTLPQKPALSIQELLPDVNTSRGAPMGRTVVRYHALAEAMKTHSFTMYLKAVKINSQGYDRGGAYWGLSGSCEGAGQLFVAHVVVPNEHGDELFKDFYRGTRESVKAQILKEFPHAKFHK